MLHCKVLKSIIIEGCTTLMCAVHKILSFVLLSPIQNVILVDTYETCYTINGLECSFSLGVISWSRSLPMECIKIRISGIQFNDPSCPTGSFTMTYQIGLGSTVDKRAISPMSASYHNMYYLRI